MNIHEAVQIMIENKIEIIWGDEEIARRAMEEFNEAIDIVAKQFTPAEIELEGGGSTWWHVCGECHGAIDDNDRFCKHCGKPVKNETLKEIEIKNKLQNKWSNETFGMEERQ